MVDLIKTTAEAMEGVVLDDIEMADVTRAVDEDGKVLITYELYKCRSKEDVHFYMVVDSSSARTCIPASYEKIEEFFPEYEI